MRQRFASRAVFDSIEQAQTVVPLPRSKCTDKFSGKNGQLEVYAVWRCFMKNGRAARSRLGRVATNSLSFSFLFFSLLEFVNSLDT